MRWSWNDHIEKVINIFFSLGPDYVSDIPDLGVFVTTKTQIMKELNPQLQLCLSLALDPGSKIKHVIMKEGKTKINHNNKHEAKKKSTS